MSFLPLHRSVATCITILLAVAACGGESIATPDPSSSTGTVTSITITAAQTTLSEPAAMQLVATANDATGAAVPGRSFTWQSSDATKASVGSDGLVIAIAAGNVTISAVADGNTGSVDLTILRGVVASVVVTATGGGALLVGASAQFTAAARDEAGRTLPGRSVTWSSTDTTTAIVSAGGLVTAHLPGSVTIDAVAEGVHGSIALMVAAPTLTQVDGKGPVGHLGVNVNTTPFKNSNAYGFSYYTTITNVNPASAANTQLGWGVWVIPNNESFNSPLCPVGTTARDQFPERGPSYRGVYQTIEGGAGYWSNVQFPTTTSKFLIGGTPNCYTTGVSPGGYQMNGSLLPDSMTYIAQLSNRLLVPPDRLTFAPSVPTTLLGYGWLALPIIAAHTSGAGMAVGDASWTLFLHTMNFDGPLLFWVPDGWTVVNSVDRTGAGRSMDAQPALNIGFALEICCTPVFEAKDSSGTAYRRIPPMAFPADANGRAILMQDMRMYAKSALWDAVNVWVRGGAPATTINMAGVAIPDLADAYNDANLADASTKVNYGTSFGAVAAATAGGGNAFALQWSGGHTPGVVPEYYKNVNGTWTAVAASSVPRSTWLADQTFKTTKRGSLSALATTTASAWSSSRWAAGPFTATLNDGSIVDYVWYRFVDQPAIRRLGLDAATLQSLQTWVESMHTLWGTQGLTIAPPSAGTLTSMDPGLLVTPPAGFEKGYVPIVIRQY